MRIPEEEFLRLAVAEMDAVDRMARSLTRKRPEADDLVQDTYLQAIRARESFALKQFGIRPWLFRIMHNLFLTRLRRDSRQPQAMEAFELEDAAAASEPLAPLSITDERLDAAMEALTPDLRSILIMWGVDELSYKEIAEVVGVPIGTVMSRLHRARKRISELLADHPYASRTVRE